MTLSLPIRTARVLTYLRLHIPQATVALLFGATQADLSRDLRRLLPLIQQCFPCPMVWAEHDKSLSDRVQTLAHLPDGCEADADKGYQGLAAQVALVSVFEPATGSTLVMPRLRVKTPFKKPKGRELTDEQKAFNRVLGAIRIRVEHCLGWAILATRFRCDHTIYTSIMRTICGFVNVQTQRWQVAEANCA